MRSVVYLISNFKSFKVDSLVSQQGILTQLLKHLTPGHQLLVTDTQVCIIPTVAAEALNVSTGGLPTGSSHKPAHQTILTSDLAGTHLLPWLRHSVQFYELYCNKCTVTACCLIHLADH